MSGLPHPTSVRPDPATLASRVAPPVVTRFAPSPTGYLHLGHVVNAIYVWGVAAVLDGTVHLRLEDHDAIRSRPEYAPAIVEDVEWLGFARLPVTAPGGWVRQRDRHHLYEDALSRLRAAQHVYACDCSRHDIGGERYPGRCRWRGLAEQPGRSLRVMVGRGAERFDDLRLGPQEQTPADQCGDVVVRDRDGQWTYQFAVTVDDLWQGVTLVIRGADLVASTGRQLRLARLLAASGAGPSPPRVPAYLHHPLIFGADGAKLSKSTGAAGVRALRQQGLTAADVLERAAAAVGLIDAAGPIAAEQVRGLFAGRFRGTGTAS